MRARGPRSLRLSVVREEPWERFGCAAEARAFGLGAGLSPRGAQELAIAVAELASNVARHAGRGEIALRVVSEPRRSIEITAQDDGPGIPDAVLALRDGYSRGRFLEPDAPRGEGLGAGLGAIERLVDALEITSSPDLGTLVVARKWIP